MAFTIVGRDRGRTVSETRTHPSGAGLLASRWLENGFTEVRIEWDGCVFEPSAFRAQFVLTPAGLKPRWGGGPVAGARPRP